MKCINCKKEIEEDSNFCIHCGFTVNVVDENTTGVKKEMQEFLEFMGKVEEFKDIEYQSIEDGRKERIEKLKRLYRDASKEEPPKTARKGYDHYLNSISKKINAAEAFGSSDYEKDIKYSDEAYEEENKADDEFIKLAESYYKNSQKLEPKSKDFIEISEKLRWIAEDYFCFENPLSGKDSFQQHQAKEVNDSHDVYHRELKEWNDYSTEYNNNVSPLFNEWNDLGKKKEEAKRAVDIKKIVLIWELEESKCVEIIEAQKKIHVPEVAKNYHIYRVKSHLKVTQWVVYMAKTRLYFNNRYLGTGDSKAQKFLDEATNFYTKARQEADCIVRNFNQRAKEQGLEIPYPDFE